MGAVAEQDRIRRSRRLGFRCAHAVSSSRATHRRAPLRSCSCSRPPRSCWRRPRLHTMPLNLAAYHLTFTSISCTDPTNPFLCDVTATADVRSNLSTTPGSVTYSLVIDFSPSFDAPCNVVDETAAFTFDAGTITVH